MSLSLLVQVPSTAETLLHLLGILYSCIRFPRSICRARLISFVGRGHRWIASSEGQLGLPYSSTSRMGILGSSHSKPPTMAVHSIQQRLARTRLSGYSHWRTGGCGTAFGRWCLCQDASTLSICSGWRRSQWSWSLSLTTSTPPRCRLSLSTCCLCQWSHLNRTSSMIRSSRTLRCWLPPRRIVACRCLEHSWRFQAPARSSSTHRSIQLGLLHGLNSFVWSVAGSLLACMASSLIEGSSYLLTYMLMRRERTCFLVLSEQFLMLRAA